MVACVKEGTEGGHSLGGVGLRIIEGLKVNFACGRDQEVEATPTVDFSRLDTVLIIVTPRPDEPTHETVAPPLTRPGPSRGKP